ncbi:fatty-acid amide hydrolase 2-A [Drosophila albomicans]|uniref:Fatty-acid amide hydrolase 2-A n=1 Tax=Drosophila albomicans TaxID=7291 RepID=A0A6P8XW70_DROAB|nr:fatty-acid amide hydrolase 2-A [Drosophila albomicans]
MEFFVRLLLLTIKFVSFLAYPLQFMFRLWMKRLFRDDTVSPPITNRLLTYNVQELRNRLRARKLKSYDLVSAYIERIKLVNPILNAIVEDRFLGALRDARAVDKRIASAGDLRQLFERLPLLGLPVTVKESCALGGMRFAVGSISRKRVRATEDGVVVARIRAAGAIPLLVSATPEYCYSVDTDTLINGRSLNPYDYGCTPGGSSGGEGALNGAGASLFGIGSDIGGSIRIPSLFCGVFGHKPTGGIVSVDGHFPNSNDADFKKFLTIGPITRFATDLSPLLEIMAGPNAVKLRLHEPVELTNIKVHYSFGFQGLNGLMHQSVERAIKRSIQRVATFFTRLGLKVQRVNLPGFRNSLELGLSGIARLENMQFVLDGQFRMYDTLRELARSSTGNSIYTTNALIFDLMRRNSAFMPGEQLEAYKEETEKLTTEMIELLGEDGVLLFPTMHSTAPRHGFTSLHLWGVDYTLLFNVLGLPVTHVPMGLNGNGLPIGFSVIAGPHQDRLCLRMAVELEQAFGGWWPPSPHEFDIY